MKAYERIAQWAQEWGTPFYLYDEDALFQRYHELRKGLHPSIDIALSLKANNNITLASLFRSWGSGIEVASSGELYLARMAGFPPERILFSGPGKSAAELNDAIDAGIACIHAESFDEVDEIASIAASKNMIVNIGIRINPNIAMVHSAIRMGGAPRQFGIDESSISAMASKLKQHPFIRFRGIHVYTGTQILDSNQLIRSFRYILDLARKWNNEYELPCEWIDLGGGFGVPYFPHEQELDMDHVCRETNEMVDHYLREFPGTRFIVESGRYLLADAGYYIARIQYIKESKGEKFLILDGGMHHHVSSTFRGRTMRNNFPIRLVRSRNSSESEELERVHLVGPLCTPEDCLAKDAELPKAQVGDYIVLLKSGAYGLSYSPLHFLGHPTPLEVLDRQGRPVIIRERGTAADLLIHQSIPNDMNI